MQGLRVLKEREKCEEEGGLEAFWSRRVSDTLLHCWFRGDGLTELLLKVCRSQDLKRLKEEEKIHTSSSKGTSSRKNRDFVALAAAVAMMYVLCSQYR